MLKRLFEDKIEKKKEKNTKRTQKNENRNDKVTITLSWCHLVF